MRIRGFEHIREYQTSELPLPERKTAHSAGYDIVAAEDVLLAPGAVTLVPTGIKAYMQPDEYLGIHIRSGLSVKNSLSLVNGQGVIDADYYDNPGNEGHILIAFVNHGDSPQKIARGDRIAQGIFYKYLRADGDSAGSGRTGGIGSTGK